MQQQKEGRTGENKEVDKETRKEGARKGAKEDGSKHGTHMHSGTAPDQDKARADITATILWIEDKWPTEEYFQGA